MSVVVLDTASSAMLSYHSDSATMIRSVAITSNETLDDLPDHCPTDVGMSAPVQSPSLLLVAEYLGGQFASVDVATFQQNSLTKMFHNQFPSWLAGLHYCRVTCEQH